MAGDNLFRRLESFCLYAMAPSAAGRLHSVKLVRQEDHMSRLAAFASLTYVAAALILDFLTPPSQPCVLAKACCLTLRDQNKRRPVSLG